MTAVDIGVCTFRRAHVANTLNSLSRLTLPPGCAIRVIVADNDDTESSRDLVESTARETGLSVTYVHAPARNISVARNACLDTATATLFAFIDDDEMATPPWLSALLSTMETTGADVVLGPVNAVYAPETPEWMREGDFHSVMPVWVAGQIVTGYAGNVLIRRSPAFMPIRFREAFGSGGEDTAYFSAIHAAGGRIVYSADAVATEAVPPERAQLSWLLKRRYKAGQTHGRLLREKDGGVWAWLKNTSKAKAKALFCGLMALCTALNVGRRNYWLLRGALHAGTVSGLLKGKAA